jgi:hypothetical protein
MARLCDRPVTVNQVRPVLSKALAAQFDLTFEVWDLARARAAMAGITASGISQEPVPMTDIKE